MKLATWNVNSLAIRLPQVVDWVVAHQPDVLVLQETKLTDDRFPANELRDAGYHTSFHGQKSARMKSAGISGSCSRSACTMRFACFEQPPNSWSWWDYRMLAFQKNRGLRIDHILVSEALKLQVRSCSIDRRPRKHMRPSDHAPVMVELQL